MNSLLQDVRYGLRMLAKNSGLTVVAVFTLALGIGANTAIFTLINAVMLRTLPVKDPGQLVLFYDGAHDHLYTGNRPPSEAFSHEFWEYLRDHNDSFESLSAFCEGSERLTMHLLESSQTQPE